MNQKNVPEAWVELPDVQAAVEGRRGRENPYDFGYVPAMGRLIGAHPAIGQAFGMLFAQIMFAPGALSRAEKEMVAGVAAAAQDCHY